MEVKLVHPSDPEKKVITVTDEYQAAAYRSQGFVEEADLQASKDAEASDAKSLTDLQAKLDATEKELAETKKALKKAKAEGKTPKTEESLPVETVDPESEGDK